MKALVYEKYGSADNLHIADVAKPTPQPDEVLIKVKAASVNMWDCDLLSGRPYIFRLMFDILKPKHKIIGSDVSGTVESIGENVTDLKIGDEVFGDISESGFGAFAEYVCTNANLLEKKPTSLSFEETAAVPQGGVLALQAIMQANVKEGDKVLINGAGGSVGPFAIQLAKLRGAEVIAVDSKDKFVMLKSVGADELIDYKENDFTKLGTKYDFILDNICQRSISDYKRVLNENGVCLVVGGLVRKLFAIAMFGSFMAKKEKKKIALLIHKPKREHLESLNKLFEKKQLKIIIDKIYPLDKTGNAISDLAAGNLIGKAVIQISD